MRKAAVALMVLATPRAALACPVCFGQNDSPLAVAMNQGVFFMLIVVFGMLGAFATFFITLARRQRTADAEFAAGDDSRRHDPQEGTARC